MPVALLVQDVGVDLLAQAAAHDAEQSRRSPGRGMRSPAIAGRTRPTPGPARPAASGDDASQLCSPVARQAGQLLVIGVARQGAAGEVDLRQVKLGHHGHADTVSRTAAWAQARPVRKSGIRRKAQPAASASPARGERQSGLRRAPVRPPASASTAARHRSRRPTEYSRGVSRRHDDQNPHTRGLPGNPRPRPAHRQTRWLRSDCDPD